MNALAGSALRVLLVALFPRRGFSPGRRLLVLRTGSIGDLIVVVPTLRFLRSQLGVDGEIRLLTAISGNANAARRGYSATELLEGLHDGAIEFDPFQLRSKSYRTALRRRLTALRADRVIVLPYAGERFFGLVKKIIALRILGIRRRPEGCLTPPGKPIRHQAARALQAAGANSTQIAEHNTCEVGPFRDAAESLDAILDRAGIPADRPWLLIGMSAKFEHKRWPVEKFAATIAEVRLRHDFHPILIGAAEDIPLAERLQGLSPLPCSNLCGRLTLRETVELARRAAAYVGNDTGAAHLAAAAGIPTITVFSGIHGPGVWDPWSPHNVSIRHTVPCYPCRSETYCPTGTMECLRSIQPLEVASRVIGILASSKPVDHPCASVPN